MAGELTSILRNIVSKAAAAPSSGEASSEIERLRGRYKNCTEATVVLADCSHSMASLIGSSDRRKIEHVRIALTDLLEAHPKAVIIVFGSWVKKLRGIEDLPDESGLMGGTNLGAAIEEAAKLRPRRTIIISDGLADNCQDCLEQVDHLTGRVDCVYCGPDGDTDAVGFLQSLSRKGGGSQMTFDGCRELSPMIRGLLC
jgi:hypothetical protein